MHVYVCGCVCGAIDRVNGYKCHIDDNTSRCLSVNACANLIDICAINGVCKRNDGSKREVEYWCSFA